MLERTTGQVEQQAIDLPPIAPWSGAAQIPWNDPQFSERMLKQHLSQANDEYSRRVELIQGHVEWLHFDVLQEKQSRVLDLGCGPGLYTERLARLGHDCVGLDFSPASIRYARERAEKYSLSSEYIEADLTTVDYGGPFDLVFFVYGEFNAFPKPQAAAILARAYEALAPGGSLVLELCRLEFLAMHGSKPKSRQQVQSGPFAPGPYSRITESAWFPESRTAVERNVVIEAQSDKVSRFVNTLQGYTEGECLALLGETGFENISKSATLGKAPSAIRRIDWSWTFHGKRPV
jgi:ubiquinone/menaquinone biosynthesis C-methylase UbiE